MKPTKYIGGKDNIVKKKAEEQKREIARGKKRK